jgi:DNA repair photolyase
MKPVHPQNFYITQWAADDPRCVARMERLMRGFGVPVDRVQLLQADDLEGLIRAKDWFDLDVRQGQIGFEGDPDVVFNKMLFPTPEQAAEIEQRYETLRTTPGGYYTYGFLRMLYGIHEGYHYEDGLSKRESGVTCWSLYDLHSVYGCFHKCRYCRRGRVTTLTLNIEDFLGATDRLMAENPWQRVFRYDVETDCLPLEPEFGMCQALVEHFAGLEDKYLILFSKSDNVDFLLDLPHRGQTIMLWTLSTPTVSRVIEVDTATTEQRIEAARKCQQAGYTVRFKCKPIVPIANWRAEATEMFEKLFAAVEPDNISMEMLFFDNMAEFRAIFPVELFDPALLARMDEIETTTGFADRGHPFPDDLRAEIYTHYLREIKRLSPQTRVSLCAETRPMWERLSAELDCTPDAFTCNCGPVALPDIEHGQLTSSEDGKALIVND